MTATDISSFSNLASAIITIRVGGGSSSISCGTGCQLFSCPKPKGGTYSSCCPLKFGEKSHNEMNKNKIGRLWNLSYLLFICSIIKFLC